MPVLIVEHRVGKDFWNFCLISPLLPIRESLDRVQRTLTEPRAVLNLTWVANDFSKLSPDCCIFFCLSRSAQVFPRQQLDTRRRRPHTSRFLSSIRAKQEKWVAVTYVIFFFFRWIDCRDSSLLADRLSFTGSKVQAGPRAKRSKGCCRWQEDCRRSRQGCS